MPSCHPQAAAEIDFTCAGVHNVGGRVLAEAARPERPTMTEGALQPDIQSLLDARDFGALKRLARETEVHELASLVGALHGAALGVVFRLLPQERAGEVFGDLALEQQEELLSVLSSEAAAAIVNEMPPDERTELLEELPGEVAQRLLASLRGSELRVARDLLAYPADSVGRLMTPEYVAVRPDWPIEKVLEHIRKVAPSKETLSVVYVVDDKWRLLDEVLLEQVILADPADRVGDLMDGTVASLSATDDQEASIEVFKKYDAVALPVVNSEGVLVGIVTFDDVMDVAEEEYTEDLHKMTGMAALEYSYFGTSFGAMVGKRLPWLAMLLAAQTFAALVLDGHRRLLAVLGMFMPLINATAGNTGSQVAGLMIRGLALQEVAPGDWLRVLLRELGRGLLLGVPLAAMAGAIVLLFGRGLPTAAAVSLAMVGAVSLANLLGAMLPFLFKGVGVDPAVTSGPFIACLMDVTSIAIYFTLAAALLESLPDG
jgi:magnesium transporter